MKSNFGVKALLWIMIGGGGMYFLTQKMINEDLIPSISEVIEQNRFDLDENRQSLNSVSNNVLIRTDSSIISAYVSRSEEDRNRGLSGREYLNDGEGMLFVFASSTRPGFWMKDMKFPIDIIWINADKEVVGIESNIATSTFPKLFFPEKEILYVLEMGAYQSEKMSIKIDSKLDFCVDNCVLEEKIN